jgi:starch phosphorylase
MTANDLFAHVPKPIDGLGKLAYNLWWSWHSSARELFRVLDLQAWRESGHNPIRMLASLSPDALQNASEDPEVSSQ